MRLELALTTFLASIVPQILAQVDPRLMLTLMGSDLKLPPKPPRSLFPDYYRTPQQIQQLRLQQRQQQEIEVYKRLKAMSPAEVRQFQARLSPTQLQQLVERLKVLKQLEQQGKLQPANLVSTQSEPNMILSGANKVRRPGDSQNTVAGRGTPASSIKTPTATLRRPIRRRPANPLEAIHKYQSFRKKSANAISAGCTYPIGMESTMDTIMAFSSGNCATSGAVCFMSGQGCVDVGMSIMCCPPGYTSGTLDMFGYMRRMEQFMAQFQ